MRALPTYRRFEIHREIGSGGAGRVYLARDRYTGAGPIALKVLEGDGVAPSSGKALESEFLALRELSHPGLVRVHERGILHETGEFYYTSEFLPGRDFLSAIRDSDPEEVLDLTIQTLRTLEYIHRRGYVHSDLKPGNLMVTEEGQVKLLDFGLAAREGEKRPEGRIRGTLPYVSPETLEGRPVDRLADLYSLGVVLFEGLVGEIPARGEDLLPDFGSTSFENLPAPFADLLPRLLARDPARRPATAAKAIDAIAETLGREIPVETEEALRVHVLSGHFVGREVELGTLMKELREMVLARDSRTRARVVVVQGEAGIGKHRLLMEFKDRCQREGVDFFSAGRIEREGAGYAALEPLLRALVARVGEDSPRVRRARSALSRILPELRPKGKEREEGELSGADERLAWLDGIAHFIKDAALGPRGYALAFEEVHQAPQEIAELLGYLVRALFLGGDRAPPVLLVLSVREGDAPTREVQRLLEDLSGGESMLPIRLRGFSSSEVREFVRASVSLLDPPKRLVEMLHQRTGGNPLFLEQLLGGLIEDGTIYHSHERWRVRKLSGPRLPESVMQAARRRISGLSESEISVLEVVAAYGEPTPLTVIEGMVSESAPAVRRLLARQILRETVDGRAVMLRHALVARILVERAGARRLRDLHAAIGEVILRLEGESEIWQTKVAHHLSLGSDRNQALRWALREAEALSSRGEHDRAAIFYARALARLEKADPRRPELLEDLGDSHASAGRPELAASAWRAALEGGESARRAPDLHRKLAEVLDRTGAYAEALAHARNALELIGSSEPEARIPLLRILGGIHRRLGDYGRAIQSVREGLRLARGVTSKETASLLNLLGNIYMLMGEHRKALNLHLRSLRFSESIGFGGGSASALHNLGTLMNTWGDPDRALDYYRRSLKVNERLRHLPAVALTYNNIANIHSNRGDYERAGYYHRRCLGLRRRIGDPLGIAMSFGNIGSMHRLSGQWGLAIAYYERSVRHFVRIGSEHGAAFFRCRLADLLIEIGAMEQAGELVRSVESVAAKQGFRRIRARALLLRARMDRLTGRPDEAYRILAQAMDAAEEASDREALASAWMEMALAQRDRGWKGHALRALHRAADEAKRLRSEEVSVRCRFLRHALEPAPSPERDQALLSDIDAFVEHARRTRRPESVVEGVAARAAFHLRAGRAEDAGPDLEEGRSLAESLAATLPDELAGIYRKSVGRGKLMALSNRVHTEADAGATPDREGMKPEILSRLFEINKRLNTETDLPSLLELIMDTAVELTGAERGFLILVENNRIAFQVARNFRRKEVEDPEVKISQSIVKHVLRSGEAVLTDNATEDERFSESQSVDNLKLSSILSVPFQSRGVSLGALYLDNRARRGVFTNEDVETVMALADQAAIAIQNLQSKQQLAQQLEAQTDELTRVKKVLDERPYKYDYDEIVGRSSRMKEVFLLLDKIIDTEVPVLIQGESGTGKELVARAIHYMGPRKSGPFVTVNCGAVPESLLESEFFGYVKGAFTGANTDKSGLFVQAHKGTLFLDEIGDMDFDMQMKLLRVLQQSEVRPVGGNKTVRVDVRIVCATNKDLRQRMIERKFREDLYYRINVISITLPPLRERRDDIPLLCRHITERTAEEMGLPLKEMDQAALALLTAYSWPGNVRELQNEIKKAMALSDDVIGIDDLSQHIQGDREDGEPSLAPQMGTLKETMEATERSIIVRALEETGGNQTQAARNLGISRVWLRKKMEKYGLLG